MRKLFLSLSILFTGCATQVTSVNVPGIERSASVQIKDVRAESEKQGETFSISISNDAYAIYRVADNGVAPPAIRLLQHRAYEKFGAGTNLPEIRVHHLVIYRNLQAELRRGVIASALGGFVGALVAGQGTTAPDGIFSSPVDEKVFEALGTSEYKRALYSEQENPGKGSVNVIYMETEIQGKKVFTRTIAPVKGKDTETPLAAAVETAIKFHLSQY